MVNVGVGKVVHREYTYTEAVPRSQTRTERCGKDKVCGLVHIWAVRLCIP